jgi:hypothetical protein
VAVRLTLDADLRGYWGFDEALETDTARDATVNALHLTVTNASSASLGRVGGARGMNGTSSFASVTSALLRVTGDLTLIGWFRLSSVNTTGSLLRCFVSCGGPTVGDGILYAISVKSNGALEYRHTASAGEVLVTTPVGTIKTNQFYSLAIRRVANGPDQDIEIFLDNHQVTPATVTVNGSPSALPVPPPAANASAVFSVGRLQRVADSAFWDGLVDEVSFHSVARPYQPYLIGAYYQASLRAGTTKLTATDNVVAVSSYEMGSGVRWWCVERDRDLYVVKESPFGQFGTETRLTTPGGGNSGNTGRPELLYDAASDTLYVFFFAGNRIYKLTANSTDDPATINMPFTADTGGIIKSLENVDGGRLGEGAGSREPRPDEDITYVNRQPIKIGFTDPELALIGESGGGGIFDNPTESIGTPDPVSLIFGTAPDPNGFGLFMGPANSQTGGYIAYRLDGGVVTTLATPVLLEGADVYFTPIASRVYGRGYLVQALTREGHPSGVYSPVIVDRFGEGQLGPTEVRWLYGNDGDGADSGFLGDGSAQRDPRPDDITYVNRAPLKFSTQDPDTNLLGEGAGGPGGKGNADGVGSWTQAGTTRII